MFWVDRERELEQLEGEYERPGFSLAVVSGRRRVGKTALVRRFLREKPGFYFEAERATFTANLVRLMEELAEFAGLPTPEPTLKHLRTVLFRLVEEFERRGRKFVFVLDEFPRLTEKSGTWTQSEKERFPSFDSVLQRFLDEGLSERNFMLVLLGSSASLMRNLFQHGGAPLYGRSTLKIFLKPLSVEAVAEFFGLDPENPEHKKALYRIWSTFGGTPYYLGLLRNALAARRGNLDKALRHLLLETATLRDEPRLTFQDEAVSAEILLAIVQALRDRELPPQMISERTGVRNVFPYLDALRAAGVAEPVLRLSTPEKTAVKNVPWRLVDPFLRIAAKLGRKLFTESASDADWRKVLASLSPLWGRNYEILWQSALSRSLSGFVGERLTFGSFLLHDPKDRKTYEFDGAAFLKVRKRYEVLFVFESKGRLEEKHLAEISRKLSKLAEKFPLNKKFFVLLAEGESTFPEAERLLRTPLVRASFPTETFLENLKARLAPELQEPEPEIVLPSFGP